MRRKLERPPLKSQIPPAGGAGAQDEGEVTDANAPEAVDAPFLITASELRERQTLRRRKLHLSTRFETIQRLVELGRKPNK
jgi:hypothetical protein